MTLEEKITKLRKELDEQTEKELTKALRDLPHTVEQIIHNKIETLVAEGLGMNNRWGRWEVDNCNGRKTALANAVGEMVAEKLGAATDEWVAEATKKGTLPKGWKEGLRKEFDEQVDYQLRMFIKNYAAKAVADRSAEMVKRILEAPPTKTRAPKDERDDYEDV